MPVTAPQMSQIFVHCAQPDAWVAALNPAMSDFDITTPPRTAAFLSQIAYESGEFNHLLENLNYSAQRLVQVWPSRFPTLPVAIPYAGDPEKLANFIYANRLGNGPPASGDGWKYRGRGLIQLDGARQLPAGRQGDRAPAGGSAGSSAAARCGRALRRLLLEIPWAERAGRRPEQRR